MGRLSNILKLVQRSGQAAERIAKKRLTVRRKGNSPMNTFGLLSDSITFHIKENNGLANLTLESFEEGLILNDGYTDVPFRGKAGNYTDSQYITQLAIWAAKKFYGGNYKKGLKAAFAIAKTQKANNSGVKHPGWMDEVKEKIDDKINEILTQDTILAIQADTMAKLNLTI